MKKLYLAFAAALLLAFPAMAQSGQVVTITPPQYKITLSNQAFAPSELMVPMGQKIDVQVENLTDKAAEFESETLHREKLVPAHGEITIAIGPLDAGSYPYVNDFDETVKGTITAK